MITIKPARMDEYGDIIKFYSELIDSMRGDEYRPEWKMGVYPTEQFLTDAIKEQTLFIAYLENCVVGAFILNHDYEPEYEKVKWRTEAGKEEAAVIHALGVAAAYQGQGVAKQIVLNIIEMCKKNAVKTIRLDVLKKNIPAAKLYLSMGFQYITSVKIFYEDTGLTDFQLYELVL